MSRREHRVDQPIAKRLRFMRGKETQEAFAKRIGISRSALANYETGRSRPDDFTLAQIIEKTGVPPDYFASYPHPSSAVSLEAAVGSLIDGRVPDWSHDEATVIRILRLCDHGTVLKVLRLIKEGASKQEVTLVLSDVFTVQEDLQRLHDLADGNRSFMKGPLATYAEGNSMHRIGFKTKGSKGPQ